MTVNDENPPVPSYDDRTYNEDDSVDVNLGPQAPDGLENNWVDTSVSDGWFVWFRFYSPTQAFFGGTWQLPGFELIDQGGEQPPMRRSSRSDRQRGGTAKTIWKEAERNRLPALLTQ